MVNTVKGTKVNIAKPKAVVNAASASMMFKRFDYVDAQGRSNGCSRHMTWNMSYLTNFEEIDGVDVAFRGSPKGGKITGKDTIKTGNLDFEDVYFLIDLKFNLFSVSQMCDKKNSVLFNDSECIVLSPNFKLIHESHVLLKVPRNENMYSVDLMNIVPKGGLTCLFEKARSDESKLWHRRLGHINFKTMNKLVKGNLVRGKFDGKADEGFFVGYSINRSGPNWLFDIDALIMNYKPVVAGNQSNGNAGTKVCDDIGDDGKKNDEEPRKDSEFNAQEKEDNVNSTNNVHAASTNEVNVTDSKYTQEEGIDYDEVFAPIARIEAIRLFLAYASFKDFMLYQMDVKSDFIYGTIDKTLFIRRDKGDILLVQVYVDDIMFGSTKKLLCTEFEKMMHKKFQISSMGELIFFLGLQVKQKEDRIFISQDKYVTKILKKFGFTDVKTASTPMETQKPLLKDEDDEEVDCVPVQDTNDYAGVSLDRKSTIGGYQFLGCRLISWQCKKQTVVANSTTEAEDSNEKKLIQMIKIHTDKKDRSGIVDFMNAHTIKYALIVNPTIYTSCIEQFWATAKVKIVNEEEHLQALVDKKKVIIIESTIRRDLHLEDVEGTDYLPNATIFEQLALMGYEKLSQKLTFYKAFFSPQ
ncbi:putative ribonuclease H-like domain-containing protein [Tanacetum coccineum]|uniref:Ribonuclease H-like domain-containing protein n=1 Tax=Tanacetum coccineum TaxID=301880 RepID=A0ABQ5FDH2_9ASTR